MPNVMAAQPSIGGTLCESSVIPFLVPCGKIWLRPTLYFGPVVSSSSFFYLFSSPNLSRPRLDVYHTNDVALVRILDSGLKHAARSSLEMQDAKNRHLRTIAQICRATSSQLKHVSTIKKIY